MNAGAPQFSCRQSCHRGYAWARPPAAPRRTSRSAASRLMRSSSARTRANSASSRPALPRRWPDWRGCADDGRQDQDGKSQEIERHGCHVGRVGRIERIEGTVTRSIGDGECDQGGGGQDHEDSSATVCPCGVNHSAVAGGCQSRMDAPGDRHGVSPVEAFAHFLAGLEERHALAIDGSALRSRVAPGPCRRCLTENARIAQFDAVARASAVTISPRIALTMFSTSRW